MTEEWRQRIRTIAFKPHIYTFIKQASDTLKVNFNLYVNKLLEAAITTGQAGPVDERIQLEFERDKLLAEERQLRRNLNAILRSGPFLQNYAQKLILGGPEQIAMIKKRQGIYANADTKELDIVLRILQQRENLSKKLVEVEDQLLPKERYPIAYGNHGFEVGHKSRSRGRMTPEQKPEREEEKESCQ